MVVESRPWQGPRLPPLPGLIALIFVNWPLVFWVLQEKLRRRQRAEGRASERIKRRQDISIQVKKSVRVLEVVVWVDTLAARLTGLYNKSGQAGTLSRMLRVHSCSIKLGPEVSGKL